jgi:disulfide bond formation protein DsbB
MIHIQALGAKPQWLWRAVSLFCVALLAGGLYLQHVVGLEPCPMCIVQRYALVLVALSALMASFCKGPMARFFGCLMATLWAMGGAYVAARQSWLQWHPPEIQTCGRDFYGMIETFPLKRAIPMIFRGGGDCTQVDWTFLGGSIANWSFLAFACLALIGLISLVQVLRERRLKSVF